MTIREPFNALSHAAGALLALFGSAILLLKGGGVPAHTAALAIYGLSLIGLFSASAAYHWAVVKPSALQKLRKFDHSAIYLLIAGTYTPLCVIAFTGFWQWGMLAIIWSLAAAGIIAKLFIINTPRWITAGLYIAMGWLSIIGIGEFQRRLAPVSIAFLLAGGLLYTLGAVIYITRKGNFFPGVFGFHELWHVAVMLGAATHYAAVYSLL